MMWWHNVSIDTAFVHLIHDILLSNHLPQIWTLIIVEYPMERCTYMFSQTRFFGKAELC